MAPNKLKQWFHLWGALSQGLQTLFVLQTFVPHLFFFLFKVKQILFFIFQHGSLQSSWFNSGHQGFLVILRCFFREQRPTRGDTEARFLITIHQAFFFSWIVELKPLTAECICLLLYSLLLASCCHPYILALMCPSEPSGRKTDQNRNLVASSVKSSQITDDAWPTSQQVSKILFHLIYIASVTVKNITAKNPQGIIL